MDKRWAARVQPCPDCPAKPVLIVERPDAAIVAIETKLSDTVTDADVAHILWLRRQIGGRLLDAIVVYTGTLAYRRRDDIGVVPLALLGP